MWRCEICETWNQDSDERCVACDAFRPSADSRENEILKRQFQHKAAHSGAGVKAAGDFPEEGTPAGRVTSDIVEDNSILTAVTCAEEKVSDTVASAEPEKPVRDEKTTVTEETVAPEKPVDPVRTAEPIKPVDPEEQPAEEKPAAPDKPTDGGEPDKRKLTGSFDYEDDYEPEKRSRKWLWIVIGVVVIVLLAGGGLLFMLSRDGGDDMTAAQPEESSETAAEPAAGADAEATADITAMPTAGNTAVPAVENTAGMTLPTAEPTQEPTAEPTVQPTAEPSVAEEHYLDGIDRVVAGDNEGALYSFLQADGYDDAETYARELLIQGAQTIATGNTHSIWIADGRAVVNGNNFYSQCEVGAWPGNLVQVAAGKYHSVGLASDGSVWFAGDNYYGQIFDRGWQNVTVVAAGSFHTVALMQDGTVAATGQDVYGQCAVNSWSGVTAIAAGERHTAALRSDGTVVAAGDNSCGQLNVSGWTDIVQIACGEYHTVGLKADGTVVAAGLNESGQCDVQTVSGAVFVSAGTDYSLCVMRDGSVQCITTAEGYSALNSWKYPVKLSTSANHSLGMFPDGSLMMGGSYYQTMEQGANARMDIYDVVTLQRALMNRGFTDAAASGQYNAQTAQAVAAAQAEFGLEATGIADPEFQTILYSIYSK